MAASAEPQKEKRRGTGPFRIGATPSIQSRAVHYVETYRDSPDGG